MSALLSDAAVIERVFEHIDNGTTDEGEDTWQEPTGNYDSLERLAAERQLLRHLPVVFCPSLALPDVGSFVARTAAGAPLVVVRGEDGQVRAFRNACRHRGMQVAQGGGCVKAFVCPYHAWTYRLDGRLQHITHDRGFPDLDKSRHGLVPVHAHESHGLVFVTQDVPLGEGALDGLGEVPELITPDQQLFDVTETTSEVNWKLNMEAALEGYHIKPAHRDTFYPYGFDNLNVVETFGNNSRITFPFRRIEKLRGLAPPERRIDGMVTYVYQLFPNVTIAVLSNHTSMVISEPESPTRTRFITYRFSNRQRKGAGSEARSALQRAKRDQSFVSDSGGKEDAAIVRGIQASLASGANDHFTYGRFEMAIVHFHKTLTASLRDLDRLN